MTFPGCSGSSLRSLAVSEASYPKRARFKIAFRADCRCVESCTGSQLLVFFRVGTLGTCNSPASVPCTLHLPQLPCCASQSSTEGKRNSAPGAPRLQGRGRDGFENTILRNVETECPVCEGCASVWA
jgi:hypothetical protein